MNIINIIIYQSLNVHNILYRYIGSVYIVLLPLHIAIATTRRRYIPVGIGKIENVQRRAGKKSEKMKSRGRGIDAGTRALRGATIIIIVTRCTQNNNNKHTHTRDVPIII